MKKLILLSFGIAMIQATQASAFFGLGPTYIPGGGA